MSRLIFIISLVIFASFVFSLEVQPLAFEKEVSPGEKIVIPLKISSEVDQKVSLTLLKYTQQEDGKHEFVEYEESRDSVSNWFAFPKEVFLRAYYSANISVEVKVPYTAKGTYVSVIMVEPEEEGAVTGITIKVRFAVLIVLRVSAPGLRQSYEIEDFEIIPDENKEPVLTVKFHNNSPLDYFASLDAAIRGPDGRTVEKVHLETGQSSSRGIAQTWLIPDARVVFSEKISKILSSGKYKVHLYVNYGDRQRIVTKSFQIDREQFNLPEPKELYLLFERPDINLHLKPRSVKTELVSVTNKGKEPVDVSVALSEIRSNYENSLLPWTTLRGKEEFSLSPGKSSKTVLTFKVPADAQEGAYYGKLVYTASKDATPIISRDFLLSLIIGEPTISATLLSFDIEKGEDQEILLSALLENNGEVHLANLKGTYEIFKPGEIVPVFSGELEPSREGWILPEEKVIMAAILEGILEEGNYILVLKVYDGEEFVMQSNKGFEIKNNIVGESE